MVNPVPAEVQVESGHPRIFYTAETIPDLVARCEPGGIMASEYAAMKARVDGYTVEKRAMSGNNLPALCIVYQVEKALGHDVAGYVDFLVKGLWGTDGKGGGSDLEPGDMWLPGGRGTLLDGYMGERGNWFSWDAVAYDWFHDALTPEQRLLYGNLIGQWMHSFMGLKPEQPAEITLQWGNYIYNQTWGDHGNNYSRDGVSSKTYVALALAGEGTDYEASIRQWLASWEKMVPSEFLPAIERMGGAWVAGPGHGGGTGRMVTQVLLAWKSATGEDLFPSFGPGGLKEMPWWLAFGAMPHNNWWAHQNDTGAGMAHPISRLAGTLGPMLGSIYKLPQAQWLTAAHTGTLGQDGSWAKVLWVDPSVRTADSSEFPTSYFFQGSGQTYMRSGWTGPDDTWAYFVCGPHYVGYQSPEDGTFQIYKGGGLAMRGGTDRYSGIRPASMNAVLIYNPDEVAEGRRARNDGGVKQNPGAPLEPVERGHMSAFQHEEAFTYATADLTNAYDSSKVESYTRQFVYLRSDPECFVVYDRVRATKGEFPKLWQLHVMNEPVFYAGDRRLSDGASVPGLTPYPEADRAVTSNYGADNNPADGRSEFLSSGFGAMLTQRLLPEDGLISGRGGEGHDNWGNPFSPEDNENIEGSRSEGGNPMDRSWWRIEVTPGDAGAETEFLHVLMPILVPKDKPKTAADLSLDAFPKIVHKKVTEDRVTFALQSGTSSWEVTLNRTGTPRRIRHPTRGQRAGPEMEVGG